MITERYYDENNSVDKIVSIFKNVHKAKFIRDEKYLKFPII